jgi:hypothetical protein
VHFQLITKATRISELLGYLNYKRRQNRGEKRRNGRKYKLRGKESEVVDHG